MALQLGGFVTEPRNYSFFDKAANTLERRQLKADQAQREGIAKRNAAGAFLDSYLDKKQFLTGTNYDPQIVKGLQEAIQQGAALAAQGADTPTIMMALGPKVGQLNEYSTKAKLIDKQIKDSVTKLKAYKGYNTEALEELAKKTAFYDADGKLKDISLVDPNADFITETVSLYPEKVTTGAGLDDFVNRTPMSDVSRETQTMYMGKKRNVRYDAKVPFWMDLAVDEKGNPVQDLSGNPVGLDVVSDVLTGDDGKPLVNPETKTPYKVMEKGRFNAIMQHNPDIADYIKGQVNQHFKDLGADKIPAPGTAQYDMMARAIAYDEFKTRDRSSFKTRENETKSAPATRIELGYPAYAPRGGSGSSSSGETGLRDVYGEVKESANKAKPGMGFPLNGLSASAQKVIIEYANKLTDDDLTQSDIYIKKGSNGVINIVRNSDNKVIAPIDFEDINLPVQPGIKEKRAVLQQSSQQQPKPKAPSGIKWK